MPNRILDKPGKLTSAEWERVLGILGENAGFDLCPACVAAAKAVSGM